LAWPPARAYAAPCGRVSGRASEGGVMNEDTFNMETRKFLKKVGVTSQREIEKAVREAIDNGRLKGDETIKAQVKLKLDDLDVEVDIDGAIELE
jgi:ribosomal protein L1